jgi:hypothetical protein
MPKELSPPGKDVKEVLNATGGEPLLNVNRRCCFSSVIDTRLKDYHPVSSLLQQFSIDFIFAK